jgi:hypothetical protein
VKKSAVSPSRRHAPRQNRYDETVALKRSAALVIISFSFPVKDLRRLLSFLQQNVPLGRPVSDRPPRD